MHSPERQQVSILLLILTQDWMEGEEGRAAFQWFSLVSLRSASIKESKEIHRYLSEKRGNLPQLVKLIPL